MPDPALVYRTDGEWMAVVWHGHLFDTTGEWIGWLDGDDVYTLEGEYVGYISQEKRLLRDRVAPFRKRRNPPARHPDFKPPQTVPLPPLFAELSYSTIDVFEEDPGLFTRVSDLRPDAGEESLRRLVEQDPRLAVQQKLREVEQKLLEEMAYGLIYSYGTTDPPVLVEAMAVGRTPGSIPGVELAPPQERVRLSEGLIERLGRSAWAQQRGYCGAQGFTPTQIQFTARALLLPRHWLLKAPLEFHRIPALARRYVVPHETVILRIHDLE